MGEMHEPALKQSPKSRILCVIAIVCVADWIAGGVTAQTPARPAFEVASVKPNRSGTSGGAVRPQGDRFTATNVLLHALIQMAYSVGTDRLIGGPSWINSDRFDIVAKS